MHVRMCEYVIFEPNGSATRQMHWTKLAGINYYDHAHVDEITREPEADINSGEMSSTNGAGFNSLYNFWTALIDVRTTK